MAEAYQACNLSLHLDRHQFTSCMRGNVVGIWNCEECTKHSMNKMDFGGRKTRFYGCTGCYLFLSGCIHWVERMKASLWSSIMYISSQYGGLLVNTSLNLQHFSTWHVTALLAWDILPFPPLEHLQEAVWQEQKYQSLAPVITHEWYFWLRTHTYANCTAACRTL